MKKILAILSVILLMSAPVLAQDFCEGNFDFDDDQDGADAFTFKADFGRSTFGNPCPPDGPAPVPKTGQTISYFMLDDGELESGVAWPYPRFTDNLDGTITDNLTGLIWLKNANCFGERTWGLALTDAWPLSSGDCGLQDGSGNFDWRLPSRFELESILAVYYWAPSLPDTNGTGQWVEGNPFNNVQFDFYWTSTTQNIGGNTEAAWRVNIGDGDVGIADKSYTCYVWPVRGGH